MDDFITHSGVKGMKWGVWNEETRRKRLGLGGRYNHNKAKKQAEKIVKRENKGGGPLRGFRAYKTAKNFEEGTRRAQKVIVKEAKIIDKDPLSSSENRNIAKRVIAGEKAIRQLEKTYGKLPSRQLIDTATAANTYNSMQKGGSGARRKLNKERMAIDIARQGANILDRMSDDYMNTLVSDIRTSRRD